ncbi:hypothetical protein LOC54_08610 [Acetobacter sp. AN02]|uniref:hypothetical protein n=1 Tax=Acetobacter sp. AN02 TaxID=2894186 RepID=UPI002434673F|nr:hypothetical protein [Acetobacter sp. AN02]MDG6095164.1 hypothetical protein [Acetobacter sp. AN02]
MFADSQTSSLLRVLHRPDLLTVAAGLRLRTDPAPLPVPFRIAPDGAITFSLDIADENLCAVCLRHAAALTDGLAARTDGADPRHLIFRAVFAATRIAVLAAAEDGVILSDTGVFAGAFYAPMLPLADDSAPAPDILAGLWPSLSRLLPEQTRPDMSAADATALHDWLQRCNDCLRPADLLMRQGGDARLKIDPQTGLNPYGCSHRPRPWAITFASTTASFPSERGFAAAEAAGKRLFLACIEDRKDEELRSLARETRSFLAGFHGLPDADHVILAASGTDCELAALAIARTGAGSRPLSSIVISSAETGSGVPLSAQGRHFAQETAHGASVTRGAFIDGFPDTTTIEDLPVRHTDGTPRSAADMARTCQELTARLISSGRHVLLHRLDMSKTGLSAPDGSTLTGLLRQFPEHLDIVIDACQTRFADGQTEAFLAQGYAVMITGSKFFTGPPFCGALLLPGSWYRRAAAGPLPCGLKDYIFRSEWTAGPAAESLPEGVNAGLILRWQASIAEMKAFRAVALDDIRQRLSLFLTTLRQDIAASPDMSRLIPAEDDLPPDITRSIETFFVRSPDSPPGSFLPLGMEAARTLHRWLNADLSDLIPTKEDRHRVAGLLCHIGQPVLIPHPDAQDGQAGALRISAGARLISGEPSHEGMGHARRMDREIADVRRVLQKISLILQHWPALSRADPGPVFCTPAALAYASHAHPTE